MRKKTAKLGPKKMKKRIKIAIGKKMKTEKDAKEEVELIFREEVENKLQLWKLVRNMMQ